MLESTRQREVASPRYLCWHYLQHRGAVQIPGIVMITTVATIMAAVATTVDQPIGEVQPDAATIAVDVKFAYELSWITRDR